MRKILLTVSFFALTICSLQAQNKVKSALDTLQKYYPQEKIYLLYNKTKYVAGETIWFSAFVFSGYELSPISSNLFVELYDNNKNLIVKKQVPVLNGQASGQITIPEKLSENVYYVHSYTQWMLNFPPERQYIHPLVILNPKSQKKLQAQIVSWKASVVAEGGGLVTDVPTKLAVRLFSAGELPKEWSGYLTETGSAEKIVSFNSMDPNVAVFQFIPFEGHQYQVVVEDKSGQRQVVTLPAVASSGVHLEAHNLYDSIQYIIRFKNIPGGGKGYKLVGTMNNEIVYEAQIRRSDSILSRFISIKNIYNGVLRLSLFDANEKVVAERLCFVNPTAPVIKTLPVAQKNISGAARGYNEINFQSDTLENIYSIMVLDPSAEDPMEKESMLSALWLSNDITNTVEAPARYFNHPGSATAEALDAILLSEHWNRFDWDNVTSGNFPVLRYFPDNYISYKGTVRRGKKLVAKEPLNLIFYFPDSSTRFVQVATDSTGSFGIQNLFFYDSAKVYFQLNSKKASAKDITVQFEPLLSPVAYAPSLPDVAYTLVDRNPNDKPDETVVKAMNETNNKQLTDTRFKTLQEVRVRTKAKTAKEKLEDELVSPSFHGFNETVFDFVNEDQHAQGYTNILNWLEGRVAGLRLEMRDNNLVPVIRGQKVSIYVDEMEIDPSFINGYSVSEIALVKVIKGFFVGGFGGGGGGAVLIYTKKGSYASNNSPSLNSNRLKGYDKPMDFPVTDYGDNVYREIKKDTREVLYWNALTVSQNDKMLIPVKFYNNDSAQGARVIMIGINLEGDPVYMDTILK